MTDTPDNNRPPPATARDQEPAKKKSVSDTDKVLKDKTHLAPPKARPRPAEKTRLAEPKKQTVPADKTRLAPSRDLNSAATQLKPRADKTRFSPAARSSSPNSGNIKSSVESGDRQSTDGAGRLKDRFILEDLLGAGGMGIVYKARDLLKVEAQDRNPYVAIKVLSDEFKSHPQAFIALQRESRKTQQIAHPNIVNVFDFDKDGDTVFMTMEFLDGKPLDQLIYQYRATGLLEEDGWKILEGLSSALIYAHEQEIVHADFKPGNIFVTNKNIAKVFDFGIARAVAKAESFESAVDDKTVFDAGNLGALTPAYASKEMLEGQPPDARDDIYALGCVAYEIFSGKHPFGRVHADEAARRKLRAEKISAFSSKQWKVIERALAFKREDRIESVDEFWQKLTEKKFSWFKTGMLVFVLVSLLSSIGYLYFSKPEGNTFSEDEFRSEIELKLRLEQHRANIESLVEILEFNPSWENNLWSEVQALSKLVGDDDIWLVDIREKIYAAYLKKIRQAIETQELEFAGRLLQNATRYAGDLKVLEAMNALFAEANEVLKERELEEKRQQLLAGKVEREQLSKQAAVRKQKGIFDQALRNVNEQLACRSGLNMRDLDIAVRKLREVDMLRYKKNESSIVSSLSACIARIGRNFPARAEEYKQFAMRIFAGNASVRNITISARDPCDLSLAGLGARGKRSTCRDTIGGEGSGPILVIIPGKGNMKAYAIGKYEVSIEEFNQHCSESKRCKEKTGSDPKLPVTNISLSDVNRYLSWLSAKAGHQYRLPTSTEWTYAAKAKSGKLDPNRNCRLNSRGIQKGDTLISTEVGGQNNWGLVNHIGNAQERVMGAGGVSMVAGGSYKTAMEKCTVSASSSDSGSPDIVTGFRVLREIVQR